MSIQTTERASPSWSAIDLASAKASAFVVGCAAFAIAGSWAKRSRVARLESSVKTLNHVIEGFLVGGGCLDGIRGIHAVVTELSARGAMPVNSCLVKMQGERQAEGNEARAIWVPSDLRISIRNGGEAGARDIDLGQ